MLDLNKLRTFTVVAKAGTITKAADLLFRTQPAITAQIRDLEEETKLILFERKNSRIYLTKEGQSLYDYAMIRIVEMDDIILRLRHQNENLEGKIRFGVQWELTEHLVPDIVYDFRKLNPNVCFEIRQYDHENLEAALLENKVDVGLNILYKQKHFFETHAFFKFERSLVAARDYLEKVPPIRKYEDLLNLDIIGFSERLEDFRFWLEKNGQKHLVKFANKFSNPVTVKETNTMHSLIKKGVGIGFGDSFILQKEMDDKQIVKILPKSEPIYVTIDIARRKVRTPNLLHDSFFDFMLARANC